MSREPVIYCPKCAWRPGPNDKWICKPVCRTVWNTFWTRGLCPGCGHQWQDTACLSCHQKSPHEDWYHYPDDEDSEIEQIEEMTV